MGVLKNFDTSVVKHDKVVTAGQERYNIVAPGMSYGGLCTTSGCEGHRKRVISNRGCGSFLVNDDIVNDVPKCPCCKCTIVVEVILLFRAKATVKVVNGSNSEQDDVTNLLARGDDVVLIGDRKEEAAHGKTGSNRSVFNSQRLVTIDVKGLGSDGCITM